MPSAALCGAVAQSPGPSKLNCGACSPEAMVESVTRPTGFVVTVRVRDGPIA